MTDEQIADLLAHPHDRRYGGVYVHWILTVDECVKCGFRGYAAEVTEDIRYCRRCLEVAVAQLNGEESHP